MITAYDLYPISVRNDSGEAIPPYAVMRQSGNAVNIGDELVIPVSKPGTTFSRLYLINGPAAIPADGYGRASDARSGPRLVKIETDEATHGHGWGVQADSWALRKNRPGNFTCRGPSNSGVALFDQDYCNAIIGQLTEVLLAGETATVNLCYGDPAVTESTIQAEVRDSMLLSGKQLPNDTQLKASWVNGAWYLDWWNGDCAEAQPPEE